ncbi:AbrB family transcriptional regulator [Acetonema longum]|uniref:Membrane protein AbrB duplication n=1 Tax=Acetonema longum DSM 6540 TaxID=1009370 RepID=F7NQE1_9FIRM|nr:AbrB family transcriptional regulator [Acetonema longum]EGO61719.1 hypothetical protein ALO_21701 [Acetonema longum DSM 6540]
MPLLLIKTFLLAVAGGCLFYASSIPLPWMLGPLTAVLLWRNIARRPIYWPVNIRNAGTVILGSLMGSSFTLETARQIALQLPFMLLATGLVIGFSLLTASITARRAGIGLASSMLGSIPGGLTQMVLLSEEIKESDLAVVSFMQTIRLLCVVFIVPFIAVHSVAGGSPAAVAALSASTAPTATPLHLIPLYVAGSAAGAWTASRYHFPTPFLVGPLLFTAALVLSGVSAPVFPQWLILISQLTVGAFMGSTIEIAGLSNWKILLPYAIAGGVGVVLFSFGLGYFLTVTHPIDLITAFLGTAPGGMTEMGITATSVHADLSIVSAYQLSRLLVILFIVPYILRWLLNDRKAKPETEL